jgi:hypothetical protein
VRGGSVLCVPPSPQPSALRLQAQGLAHRAAAPPSRRRAETVNWTGLLTIRPRKAQLRRMARRHSSASREKRRREKRRKRTPFFAVGALWGRIVNRAGSVDRLRLAWASPLSRSVYRLFAAAVLSRPPLRLVYAGRESEQADALCLHKCAATASASLSIKKRHVGSVWGLMQVYTAGDGCSSSSGLTPCRI